ncbi:hypothetical protein BH23GEM7_BH23GEM7_00960 [soil metagenome]
MSVSRFARGAALLLALAGASLLGAVESAVGQSLLASRGLGLISEPFDARARGLGGVAQGLPEPNLSLLNPASVSGIPAPALHVTYQPDSYSAEFGGRTTEGTTARFPLIHVALPLGGRTVLSLGYGSFLDQSWGVETDTTLIIGGESVPVLDRFASRGGVASLRLGGAYALNERLAVGVGLDIHTGAQRDSVIRFFQGSTLAPTVYSSLRSYSGLSYNAGVRWNPSEAFALGASLGQGGTLEARPEDEAQSTLSYQLPLTAGFGGSGRVTPTTLVAISGRWTGWSAADGALSGAGGARDTWSVGGGIEWEAFTAGERVFPFRLGARYATLPFAWQGGADGDGLLAERALSAGAGVRLGGGAAVADLSLERGNRGGDGAGLSESFWRMAVSLTVLGR